MDNQKFIEKVNEIANILNFKKNVILQGAPGTGKTYTTAAVALKILGDDDIDLSDHEAVMERYNFYRDEEERIFFTTFHQSMDYEDFVEGLKPELSKDKDDAVIGVTYEVKPGIFKKVCNIANGDYDEEEDEETIVDEKDNEESSDEEAVTDSDRVDVTDESINIWKVSLGDSKKKDYKEIKADCFEKDYIWVGGNNKSAYIPYHHFTKEMKIGDLVLIRSSKEAIDAIGVITSKPYRENNVNIRDVKWITKEKEYKIHPRIQPKTLSRQAVYPLKDIDRTKLQRLIDRILENSDSSLEEQNDTNLNSSVVLIIDEINRGNVSKIFGELVTLLEKDKREGEDHPITVTLPYSKEDFSVPSNVYIIGTMNTTDRSTGTLDYAIRRRFAFVTLPADREAIQLDIAKELFDDIESFIEDNCPKDMDIDDLMIGHSYFMTEDEDELELKIKYEVVPLLKEYCNDGLLTCSLDELNERIEAWENLEIFDDSSVETEDETDYDEDEDQE